MVDGPAQWGKNMANGKFCTKKNFVTILLFQMQYRNTLKYKSFQIQNTFQSFKDLSEKVDNVPILQ
jgi:hypothetical protein